MGEYVVIYLVAFTLSVFLVPIVRRLALKVGAIDLPDRVRKIHTRAVPRMGGVAIFIAFIVPVVGTYVLGATGLVESQVYQVLTESSTAMSGLLAASTLILLLGIYDDVRHCRPSVKILVQTVAALVLCAVGIRIDLIRNPFTGELIRFGWLAWPLTVFWVLAITNAINLIDGMDGLGPGVGLFVAGTMLLISIFFRVSLVGPVMAALVGAIIGFLIFNFHPAKIFMGDSGSLFVGFLLAAICIQGSIKRYTLVALLIPIVALALPIIDTLMAIVRRWSKGLPMSVPDKQHVHHRLMSLGFSQREAVFVLYGVSVILGCVALVVAVLESALSVAVAGGTIVAIIVGVHVLGGREFSAIGTRILQALRRRHRRRSAWIEVYNTAAKMESASSVEEMWHDIGELFTELDVDSVHVSLSEAPGGRRELEWTRPAGDAAEADVGTGCKRWTIRLPLEENGRMCGELMLAKDTHRGPLPDALFEIMEVLRGEMIKTLERLSSPAEGAAGAGPPGGTAGAAS
jgi:UDP-GlcNAc:undecaprenyl-phosphate GlcNAc-1-phosphate transferase